MSLPTSLPIQIAGQRELDVIPVCKTLFLPDFQEFHNLAIFTKRFIFLYIDSGSILPNTTVADSRLGGSRGIYPPENRPKISRPSGPD
jgi:hypothetical protein